MGKRLSLATENTTLLFLPSLLVGIAYAYLQFEGPLLIRMGVAIAVPGVACLLFTLLVIFMPVLAAGGKYTLAHCILLPIVHLALIVTAVALGTASPSALMRMPKELEPALLWLQPIPLLLTFLGEFALFALAHLRGKSAEGR